MIFLFFCYYCTGQVKIHIKPINYQPHILLYHHEKFYWRHRTNMETYMYYYPDYSVVEIVSYDKDDDKELNRLKLF